MEKTPEAQVTQLPKTDSETNESLKVSEPLNATITLITPKDLDKTSERLGIRYFETSVSLIKAIAWPFIVLLLFVILHEPIIKLIKLLPDRVAQSTKISVGSLSFEIQQAATASGNPELADLIGGLSTSAIEELLSLGKSFHRYVGSNDEEQIYYIPNETIKRTLLELEKAGLLKFDMPMDEFDRFLNGLNLVRVNPNDVNDTGYKPTRPLSPDEKNKLKAQDYSLTPVGKRAFELITEVVAQNIKKVPPSEAK